MIIKTEAKELMCAVLHTPQPSPLAWLYKSMCVRTYCIFNS